MNNMCTFIHTIVVMFGHSNYRRWYSYKYRYRSSIVIRTSSPHPYLYPPSFHFKIQKGSVYVSVDTDAVPIIDFWLKLYSTTGITSFKKKIFFCELKKGMKDSP